MKSSTVIAFLFAFIFALALVGCSHSTPLQAALNDYSTAVEGDVPEDARLVIYYLNPSILTRQPLSKDDIVDFPGVQIITVDSEELAPCWAQFKELDSSILQPVKEESYVNARLYYVLEVGDSGKVLEVVISSIHGSVFVNGIEVEDNPIFYDLIVPFLTAEDCSVLGI